MPILRFRTRSVSALTFAITLTVLLTSPSFSLSHLDSSEGDQAVQSLDVSPNRDVSIQIFGTDIQAANALSARFEYNATHVVYTGFDVGDVLPDPLVTIHPVTVGVATIKVIATNADSLQYTNSICVVKD